MPAHMNTHVQWNEAGLSEFFYFCPSLIYSPPHQTYRYSMGMMGKSLACKSMSWIPRRLALGRLVQWSKGIPMLPHAGTALFWLAGKPDLERCMLETEASEHTYTVGEVGCSLLTSVISWQEMEILTTQDCRSPTLGWWYSKGGGFSGPFPQPCLL